MKPTLYIIIPCYNEESVLPINERGNETYFPLKLQKTIW